MSSTAQTEVAGRPGIVPNLAVATAAFSFPLLASLVNLLKFYDYAITAREVWIVYLGLIFMGLIIGSVYLISHRLIRTLIEAAFVALITDINTDGLLWVVVAAAVVFAMGIIARRSLARPLAFGGFVLLLLCVVGVGDTAARPVRPLAPGTSGRPLLLHIILDEHGGIAGLPRDNPQTPSRREALKALYVGQGFRLYGAAYSQHTRTTSAIPQIMNFGAIQPTRPDNRGVGLPLRINAYFKGLQRRGYTLRIYESSWVSLCANDAAISCVRYHEAGLSGLEHSALSMSDKCAAIGTKLAGRSALAYMLLSPYDRYVVPLARRQGILLESAALAGSQLTSSLQSLEVADALVADLAHAQPGQAYVAHLLLPHYPYIVRADCSLKPRSQWVHRRLGVSLRSREDAAYEQMLCAAGKVRAAIAAIERSPAGRNYVVVIHGDHGSRITVRDPRAGAVPPPSDRDVVASFSTLFAIKAPGVAPGYVATPARVDDLLAAFAGSGFTAAPAPPEATDQVIFLEDAKGRPAERIHMPQGWARY